MLAALGTEQPAPFFGAERPMTMPPGGGAEDFERAQLVLEDARERARRIIDQSVAEAQALLNRRAPLEDSGVRRALTTLGDEMRDLRLRLDRIEALLRQDLYSGRGSTAPATPEPAPPREMPQAEAAPPAPEPVSPNAISPDEGPVTVLVSPVAGFQGLMRVQEALVRQDPVAEAVVEGYAQGEARLRLQLRAPVSPGALATGLSGALAQHADVQRDPGGERTLRVALS